MKKNIKTQKLFIDHSCGFPVTLINAPMIKIRGEWILNLDYKKINAFVIKSLVLKHSKLTGAEIKFIRQYLNMTLKEFADKFDVTHPAVKKWEDQRNQPTEMKWSMEKVIRLFALTHISKKATDFLMAYKELEVKASV